MLKSRFKQYTTNNCSISKQSKKIGNLDISTNSFRHHATFLNIMDLTLPLIGSNTDLLLFLETLKMLKLSCSQKKSLLAILDSCITSRKVNAINLSFLQ